MKRFIRAFILIVAAITFISPPLYAIDSKLSYDGQVRLRSEVDLKSFEPSRYAQNFHDLRSRVGFKFEPSDKVLAYIQFQDSRRLGVPMSGELLSSNNVDLHQVFFVVKDLIATGIYIQGGRFELNYGNQRIFGSVGWHNVGRSWDGLLLSYRNDKYRIDFFNMKRLERNSPSHNNDFDILGLHSSAKNIGLDLFLFYELDAAEYSVRGVDFQARLKRLNIGGYFFNKYRNLDFTVQGNHQLGEKPRGGFLDTVFQDISAFMVAAEIGITIDSRAEPRFAAGVDYTSGDDGSNTTDFKAYQDSYYTGHAFRGYMDYFIASPFHGLVDVMLRGKGNIAHDWIIRGDAHYFRAAEDYLSKSDNTTRTSDIGFEIDLTVVNKTIPGATFTGGFSVFFADEHFTAAGDSRETGLWSYLMTTIDF